MKKQLVGLGIAGAAALTIGGASVLALGQGFGPDNQSQSNGQAAMQSMHNSSAMQKAMSQFSPELRAQGNAMHAQMTSQMSFHMNGSTGSGMMGGQSGSQNGGQMMGGQGGNLNGGQMMGGR